jgi:hypothetical protein
MRTGVRCCSRFWGPDDELEVTVKGPALHSIPLGKRLELL